MGKEDLAVPYVALRRRLRQLLIECDVPEDRIVENVEVAIGHGQRSFADLLVLGGEPNTIVALIEIKIGKGEPTRAYNNARKALGRLIDHCNCFAVMPQGEELCFARMDGNVPAWKPVHSADDLNGIIGDYEVGALQAAEQALERRTASIGRRWFFTGIATVFGGVILIAFLAYQEWCGHEFSWKLYSLLFFVLSALLAISGLDVHFKVGENELRIYRKEKGTSK